jgi:uncharacterized protein involved in exopolysaccharide biosynthesis
MSLTSIWMALRRRAWIPLVGAALAALAVGVLTIRSQPTYTATATVIAKNPENATDRPLSFPEVVTSNTVASRALRRASVQEPVDLFETSLSVVSGKSDIYRIAVKAADPALATTLANAGMSLQALMALLFGFLGLMIAVPLLAAILVPVKMLYVHDAIGDEMPVRHG